MIDGVDAKQKKKKKEKNMTGVKEAFDEINACIRSSSPFFLLIRSINYIFFN